MPDSAAYTDPKIVGCADMIHRTGASQLQIRYADDEEPTVWFAVAIYKKSWETAAGHDPLNALIRLCEQLIDGGTCTHCGKPTAFDSGFGTHLLEKLMCWYQWDPERKTFRRGCE